MNKLIIFILTLLPVLSYSQVTSINIDTSASQVIIINNGTMIQNNGGTVNVNDVYLRESVIKLDLGKYINKESLDECDSRRVIEEKQNEDISKIFGLVVLTTLLSIGLIKLTLHFWGPYQGCLAPIILIFISFIISYCIIAC